MRATSVSYFIYIWSALVIFHTLNYHVTSDQGQTGQCLAMAKLIQARARKKGNSYSPVLPKYVQEW